MGCEGDCLLQVIQERGRDGTQGSGRTSEKPPWVGLAVAEPVSCFWKSLGVVCWLCRSRRRFTWWYMYCHICYMVGLSSRTCGGSEGHRLAQ